MDDQELLDAYRQLTDRQQRVLAHLCRGHPRVEIAMALGIKPRLVDADIAAIYRAFQLDDSGLTPAQRRFELRHSIQLVRKGEQQKTAAPATAPKEPSASLPTSAHPSTESPSTPAEEPKEAGLARPALGGSGERRSSAATAMLTATSGSGREGPSSRAPRRRLAGRMSPPLERTPCR